MRLPVVLRKMVLASFLSAPLLTFAQTTKSPLKPNWQNLDLTTDGVFGISTEKAYNDLLKGKTHVPVLVAVIDGGIDINHEDLKKVIYTNSREIAGNQKDDDHNGYADDLHGWDFIGSAKGDVHYDNLELTRILRFQAPKFEKMDSASLSGSALEDYRRYSAMKQDYSKQVAKAQRTVQGIGGFKKILDGVIANINKPNPTAADLQSYTPKNEAETYIKKVTLENMSSYKNLHEFEEAEINKGLEHYEEQLRYHLNLRFDPRDTVGDNYMNSSERFYGNADVDGPDAHHGSHVAGIIGAVRDNDLGIKGVANDVMIMSIRTVPTGDERDKDVANAIRYAADNGVKVVNMSFGKSYSWDKHAVDEAVKYAMTKDVLLVHAAGNDNQDNDVDVNVPNPTYEDKSGKAPAWIEVGASGPVNDTTLRASFSNYGKNSVDVFAPGVDIKSTTPNSTYEVYSGTSMAAPVVTGLAALIRSYYPKLTALQVKEIILKSVVKVDHTVVIHKDKGSRQVPFSELSQTGGIVNAYNALKLAATY